MIKNTAGQKIGAQMVSASDGSAFTGSVTVAVTVDAGTQATGSVGSGACTHEGNGYHTYAPAQAETNGDLIAFTFTGTGAVPATVQVYTVAGDAYTRLGAPAGASVSADVAAVKAETAAILADTGTDGVVVSATSVRSAVGLASANLDTQLSAIDDFLDTEVAAILAAVDTEVAAILALLDDARAEPSQGAPPVNPDLATKIDWLYASWRNKKDNNGTVTNLYADDGATIISKQTTSESGGTVTKAEWITGA